MVHWPGSFKSCSSWNSSSSSEPSSWEPSRVYALVNARILNIRLFHARRLAVFGFRKYGRPDPS